MQTLQIILFILGGISYMAVTFFACEAWTRLRRQNRDIREMKAIGRQALMVLMGDHLKREFEDVNRMNDRLRSLVEHEEYEQAKQLKAVIDRAEASALKSLKHFKETFGDDIAELEVTKIPLSE